MNKQYTFWKLLSDKRIVIPIVQRDYAQGREGMAYIRKNFLEQLSKTLGIIESKPKEQKAELDFIYGTEERLQLIDKSKSTIMYPLDGQQRLTTLWLLHWYVAYKAGVLKISRNILKGFAYETRTSSREFCEKLCDMTSIQNPNESIVQHIKEQIWYYSNWDQDPTIKAMLCMLSGEDANNKKFIDGIEKMFIDKNDFKSYWLQLTAENCNIQFNFLALESSELPISDDLYIKMNARGKALTSFENLKADIFKWLYEQETEIEESGLLVTDYMSLIDNQWTDVFWEKGKEKKKVDELYFAFLNRYFLNETILKSRDQAGKAYTAEFFQKGGEDGSRTIEFDYFYGTDYSSPADDRRIAYDDFSNYKKFFSFNLLKDLKAIFNGLANLDKDRVFAAFPQRHQTEKDFDFLLPSYQEGELEDFRGNKINNITSITLAQRVVFYAICIYLAKEDFNEKTFKHWIRVVWNIVDNTNEGSSISGFVSTLRLIRNISEGCLNIYEFLREYYLTATEDQLREEAIKAQQILVNEGIGLNLIEEAENTLFFDGAIRFLYTNEHSEVDWNDFNEKFARAKLYFNKDKNKIVDVLCGLIKSCPDWYLLYDKQIFKSKSNEWKNLILCKKEYTSAVNRLLTNDLNELTYIPMTAVDCETDYAEVREQLCESGLLDVIIEKHNDFRFRWNGPLAMYKPYGRQQAIVFDFSSVGRRRNYILNELLEREVIEIESDLIIQGSKPKFFYGWDIPFIYQKDGAQYEFWWLHSNWVDMYQGSKKLFDRGGDYSELHSQFINQESKEVYSFSNADELINELDRCIQLYNSLSK